MASPRSPSPVLDIAAEERNEDIAADLPMTMAASVVLDHLPKDATKALEAAGEFKGPNDSGRGEPSTH